MDQGPLPLWEEHGRVGGPGMGGSPAETVRERDAWCH